MKAPAKFQIRKAVLGLAIAALAGSASAALVWDGTLPPQDPTGLLNQQYQDFTIYSLNYLSNLAVSSPSLGLTSPTYNVGSSKGQITDYVVIATNGPPAEKNNDTCGATGCDTAYYSNVTGTDHETYFQSSSVTDPLTAVPNEPDRSTWTATGAALQGYLGVGDMVFMFNLNEDNGGDANTLDGQSLLVSMRVTITDDQGVVKNTFYVGANSAIPSSLLGGQTAKSLWEASGCDAILGCAPSPLPTVANATVLDTKILNANSTAGFISTDARWAYVHGAISVDATTGEFLAMGDCVYTKAANCKTINQNLGANQVAFAAFNETLSDLVKGMNPDWLMNVDITTAGQSNGHEQLFIVSSESTFYEVPEPGSLALAGLALAAVGVIRRRRPSTKA